MSEFSSCGSHMLWLMRKYTLDEHMNNFFFLERAHTWERHVSVACKSANFPRMQKDFPCNTVHIAAIHNSWELKVNYSDILDVKISHMGISKGCSREGIFNLSFGGFRIYTCLSNHIFLQHTTKRTTSSYNKYYPFYDYWLRFPARE